MKKTIFFTEPVINNCIHFFKKNAAITANSYNHTGHDGILKNHLLKLFVLLCLTITSGSFAKIITYDLFAEAYRYDNGKHYDLNGFLALESVGIPEYDPDAEHITYVNFSVLDFFLATPDEVLLHSPGEIKFMCINILYGGDRELGLESPYFLFSWLSVAPEDYSIQFAPKSFDIYNFYHDDWNNYFFWLVHATCTSVPVDEPNPLALMLFGLFLILAAIICRRSIASNQVL